MKPTCIVLSFLVFLAGWCRGAEKPNILFISVDDLRPELGCYGVEEIRSPNIDRLAKSGVRFDRAYCQLAVCNPSRVSLLTGLRPDSAKVWTLDVRFRHTVPDVITLPQHFKKNGYYAVSFGKIFHNPWPDNESWSEPHQWPKNSKLWSGGAKQRLADFREQMRADGKDDKAIQRMRAPATEVVDIPDSEHIDGAIADQALAAMRRLANNDEPFFLAAGFIRPHLPFVVPRKYWELYDREEIPLAENNFLPRDSPKFAMNTMYELRDYMDYSGTVNPRDGSLTEAQQRELKHGYYASVSLIDAQVGRLIDELETLGLADNTIVILWGDHGWKLGEHNSWCKQTNYEIDARVPLVIRDPRARANGEASRSLVEFIDVYPTLCDLAGIPAADHVEGTSLKPLLDDPGRTVKDAAFSQFRRKDGKRDLMGYSMRTAGFRYVEWIDRRTGKAVAFELYDHEADPAENTNLADRPGQMERLKKLNQQLWGTLPPPPILAETHQREAVPSEEPRTKPISVAKGKRPNILFLMGDDWSYPHAGALGDPVVKTPTFDRLVKEGVLFDNAFVSAPSCTPSRHAVASGQYHWRLGDGVDLGGSLPRETPVYPDRLAEAGYVTGFSRKGTAPSKHAFRGNDPFGPRFKNFEEFYTQRKKRKPFCYWYGSGEPHRPYDWEASKREGMDLDAIEVPACLPDNETVRTDLGDYYLKVQQFDRDATRMIALLEENGELDNTIVVMSGDNGMPFPRCKATLYDLGTRVPLVIRWGERIKGGRTVEDFVSLTDLAPTFLEAAGLGVPEEMTGHSLMKQLISNKFGRIEPGRDHILTGMEQHVYPYPSRAIRTGEFLYIRNFAPTGWPTGRVKGKQPHYDFVKTPWPTSPGAFSHNVDPGPSKQWMREYGETGGHAPLYQLAFGQRPSEELYDLDKDPDQLKNVADDPAYADARHRLSKQLTAELRASGDPRFASDGYTTFPVKGWTVHLSDSLWEDQSEATARMLELLGGQLDRVAEAVPPKALKKLRAVPIWINPEYEGIRPSAEYHPDAGWLRKNGRDPVMARAIEITNASIFPFENRRMPYVLLHELSHAYHDQVLGFDDPEIRAAFEKAKRAGIYDSVQRFNGKAIVTEKAYAMSNHKEYFAEATEAFFGRNDFFPFTREELKKHDRQIYDLLELRWGWNADESGDRKILTR